MFFLWAAIGSVLLFFTIKFLGILSVKTSDRLVGRKFKAAESIVEKDEIPAEWIRSIKRQIEIRKRLPFAGMRSINERKLTRDILLNKLAHLYDYFEKCPFFSDKETRLILLRRLQEIYKEWKKQDGITLDDINT